jgi:hypothetical protein
VWKLSIDGKTSRGKKIRPCHYYFSRNGVLQFSRLFQKYANPRGRIGGRPERRRNLAYSPFKGPLDRFCEAGPADTRTVHLFCGRLRREITRLPGVPKCPPLYAASEAECPTHRPLSKSSAPRAFFVSTRIFASSAGFF